MGPMSTRKRVSSCVAALVAAVLALALPAAAQQAPHPADGFSFAVYGDSRSMMYLPYRQDQEAEARKLMVDMQAMKRLHELERLAAPSN
jgi:hypothetical protein